MAQGLLALSVSVAEQTFCGTSKRLVARNSFQKIFVANFAKIGRKTVQKLEEKLFSCVFARFVKNFANFELF